MSWKKAVLLLTAVLAIILGIISVRPSQVPVAEFRESADLRLASSAEIPFHRSIFLSGFALSGSWEGPGYAQVWLLGEDKKYLVMDTRDLPEVLELSAFGTSFDSACIETCSIPPLQPKSLFAIVSGPGVLSIDSYHFTVPLSPSGLALCPNCKKVQQSQTPNHILLLAVLLLVIAVVGSHSLSHCCRNVLSKRFLVVLFLAGFVALGGLFGVSVAAPSAAVVITAQKTISVFAALALLVLFLIGAVEMLVSHKKSDLAEDEEECEK